MEDPPGDSSYCCCDQTDADAPFVGDVTEEFTANVPNQSSSEINVASPVLRGHITRWSQRSPSTHHHDTIGPHQQDIVPFKKRKVNDLKPMDEGDFDPDL
jgi:hypothetical protein